MVVWDAALVLLHFLQHRADEIGLTSPGGLRVIELGSGTGAVGISAAVLGLVFVLIRKRLIGGDGVKFRGNGYVIIPYIEFAKFVL